MARRSVTKLGQWMRRDVLPRAGSAARGEPSYSRFVARLVGVGLPLLVALGLYAAYGYGLELAVLSGVALVYPGWGNPVARGQRGSFFWCLSVLVGLFAVHFATEVEPLRGGLAYETDSAVYHLFAVRIQASVPALQQLSPLRFDYIESIARSEGLLISAPGYHKMLGLIYTAASAVGADGAWAGIALNLLVVAILGSCVSDGVLALGGSRRIALVCALAFVAHPTSFALASTLRKDPLILLLFYVGAREFLFPGGRWWLTMAAIAVLVPFRAAFAAALASWWVGAMLYARRPAVARLVPGRVVLIAAVALWGAIQAFGVPYGDVLFRIDTEGHYSALPQVDLGGGSGRLFGSAVGRVVYALLYPFPPFRPEAWKSGHEAVLFAASVAWSLLAVVVLARQRWAGITAGLGVGWVIAVTIVMGVVESGVRTNLHAVIEPRYKWPALFLALIIAGPSLTRFAQAARLRRAFGRNAEPRDMAQEPDRRWLVRDERSRSTAHRACGPELPEQGIE